MSFEAYQDLSTLDVGRLRRETHVGDAQERLWAHWALGVRLGVDYEREAIAALDRERVPGVRRHLLVMLAGFHERRLMEQVAICDPDPRARATACTQLARVGGFDDLLHRRENEDPAPEVRSAIVSALDPWRPDRPKPPRRHRRPAQPVQNPYLPVPLYVL